MKKKPLYKANQDVDGLDHSVETMMVLRGNETPILNAKEFGDQLEGHLLAQAVGRGAVAGQLAEAKPPATTLRALGNNNDIQEQINHYGHSAAVGPLQASRDDGDDQQVRVNSRGGLGAATEQTILESQKNASAASAQKFVCGSNSYDASKNSRAGAGE